MRGPSFTCLEEERNNRQTGTSAKVEREGEEKDDDGEGNAVSLSRSLNHITFCTQMHTVKKERRRKKKNTQTKQKIQRVNNNNNNIRNEFTHLRTYLWLHFSIMEGSSRMCLWWKPGSSINAQDTERNHILRMKNLYLIWLFSFLWGGQHYQQQVPLYTYVRAYVTNQASLLLPLSQEACCMQQEWDVDIDEKRKAF